MTDGASVATVRWWSEEEGRGVLDADDLPGGCWAPSVAIDGDTPVAGSRVAVWWSTSPDHGHAYRVDRVLPSAGPAFAPPFSDSAMLAALRALRTPDVAVTSAERLRPGIALLRFAAEDGRSWEVELPLPSSPLLKPWLYRTPVDAGDSAGMLGIFLDEEVVTTAVRSAARSTEGRLVLAPYGFQRADPVEHERLLRSAGDDGWSGRQTEGGPLDFIGEQDRA